MWRDRTRRKHSNGAALYPKTHRFQLHGEKQYDSIEAVRGKLDRLAADYYDKARIFSEFKRDTERSAWVGKAGAFEGSGYTAKEMYRPAIDCKMFSLNPVDFDPVCAAAIEKWLQCMRDKDSRVKIITGTDKAWIQIPSHLLQVPRAALD